VTPDTVRNCLDDTALWPAAFGEPVEQPVREHLAHCPACRGRVELLRSDVQSLRGLAAPAASSAAPLTGQTQVVPRRIGPYRIVGMLDDGAQICRCRAISSLAGDEVLLDISKTVAELAPAQRELFAAFRERLLKLDHPHLARVYDLQHYEGRAVLAQQFVRGTRLADYLRGHALARDERVALAAQLAEGLTAAHAAGVAHGRITPASMAIESGRLVLSDFGRELLLTGHFADDAQLRDHKAAATLVACLLSHPQRVADANGELPPGLDHVLSDKDLASLPPVLRDLMQLARQ
jgi:hypothetical protein